MTKDNPIGSHWQLILGGCVSAGAYGLLAFRSQAYGAAVLAELLLVCGVAGVVSVWLWICHRQQSLVLTWPWVLALACVFRAIGVLAFPPLEDDFYRYLWDGRMLG